MSGDPSRRASLLLHAKPRPAPPQAPEAFALAPHPSRTKQTAVTQDLAREVAQPAKGTSWTGGSGRQFISLTVDSGDLLREISDLKVARPATPEEVLRKQEEIHQQIDERNYRTAETTAKRDF